MTGKKVISFNMETNKLLVQLNNILVVQPGFGVSILVTTLAKRLALDSIVDPILNL